MYMRGCRSERQFALECFDFRISELTDVSLRGCRSVRQVSLRANPAWRCGPELLYLRLRYRRDNRQAGSAPRLAFVPARQYHARNRYDYAQDWGKQGVSGTILMVQECNESADVDQIDVLSAIRKFQP